MTTIDKITILGERCTGTNYLEGLIKLNFNVEITWEFGWKHFFGFSDYQNSDNVLFIGTHRNLLDWLNSFYIEHYHLPDHLRYDKGCNPSDFLEKEFYSYYDDNNSPKYGLEIMEDRNIYTKERYKNILEMRSIKLKFLFNDMHHKVKNYKLISYENLVENWSSFILNINEEFKIELLNPEPINWERYKKTDQPYKNIKKREKIFNYEMVKYNKYYNSALEKLAGYKY